MPRIVCVFSFFRLKDLFQLLAVTFYNENINKYFFCLKIWEFFVMLLFVQLVYTVVNICVHQVNRIEKAKGLLISLVTPIRKKCLY